MPIHFTDTKDLQGAQADVLWESIADNPNLKRSVSNASNKQMNTKATRVITAVNEVKGEAEAAKRSSVESMAHVTRVIGDLGTKENQDKLDALGGNVIEAMVSIKTSTDSLLSDATRYTDEKIEAFSGPRIIDGGEF